METEVLLAWAGIISVIGYAANSASLLLERKLRSIEKIAEPAQSVEKQAVLIVGRPAFEAADQLKAALAGLGFAVLNFALEHYFKASGLASTLALYASQGFVIITAAMSSISARGNEAKELSKSLEQKGYAVSVFDADARKVSWNEILHLLKKGAGEDTTSVIAYYNHSTYAKAGGQDRICLHNPRVSPTELVSSVSGLPGKKVVLLDCCIAEEFLTRAEADRSGNLVVAASSVRKTVSCGSPFKDEVLRLVRDKRKPAVLEFFRALDPKKTGEFNFWQSGSALLHGKRIQKYEPRAAGSARISL